MTSPHTTGVAYEPGTKAQIAALVLTFTNATLTPCGCYALATPRAMHAFSEWFVPIYMVGIALLVGYALRGFGRLTNPMPMWSASVVHNVALTCLCLVALFEFERGELYPRNPNMLLGAVGPLCCALATLLLTMYGLTNEIRHLERT